MGSINRVPRSRWILFWTIAIGGAAFDLITKSAVFARVGDPPAVPIPLIDNILEFRTSYNEGALWGFGRGIAYSPQIFAAMSIVAAVAIVWYLFVKGAAQDAKLTAAFGLIMAGALGNCHDRLRYGHVRDFVYFHVDSINFSCAIFNFADNMLVIGAGALMLLVLRPEPAESSDPASIVSETSADVSH